jgi:hypothetical protein
MLRYWAGKTMASVYSVSVQIQPPYMRFVPEDARIMNSTVFRWMNIHKRKVHSVVRPCLFFRNRLCLWLGV